jgi:pyruvate-formate lyase-activating enzyme
VPGERALLKIGGMCTSDCVFCHAGGPRPGSALTVREVGRRVLAARDGGLVGVVLSGGEPTAHPRFLEIARFVGKAGLELGLVTNGIALAEPGLVESLVRAGLRSVHVTLLGPDAGVHDRLAGVRSFERVASAIASLAALADVEVSVTTVVARPNLAALEGTVGVVSRLLEPARAARPSHRLALLEPKGRALGDPSLLPDPAEAAEAIGRAIAAGAQRHGDLVRRGHDGLPACLAPGASEQLDLRAFGIAWMQEVGEDRLYPVDGGRRSRGPRCCRCVVAATCDGLYAGYLPRHERLLVPVTSRRDRARSPRTV